MALRFCPTCGAKLEFSNQKFCTSCGATLPEHAPAPLTAAANAGSVFPIWALAFVALIVVGAGAYFILPYLMGDAGAPSGDSAGSGVQVTLQQSPALTPVAGMTTLPATKQPVTPAPTTTTRPPTSVPTTTRTPAPTPTRTPEQALTSIDPDTTGTSVITLTVTQVPAQPPESSYTSNTEGAPYINPQTLERRVHELINAKRQENGLSTLTYDPFLADIARGHSWDMVNRNFFEHENPDGLSPRDRGDAAGYPCIRVMGLYTYSGISENLYQGNRATSYYANSAGEIISYDWRTLDEIAEVTVTGWMNSPGHRQNILTPHFSYEGIGVGFAPDNKVYITENFC